MTNDMNANWNTMIVINNDKWQWNVIMTTNGNVMKMKWPIMTDNDEIIMTINNDNNESVMMTNDDNV